MEAVVWLAAFAQSLHARGAGPSLQDKRAMRARPSDRDSVADARVLRLFHEIPDFQARALQQQRDSKKRAFPI